MDNLTILNTQEGRALESPEGIRFEGEPAGRAIVCIFPDSGTTLFELDEDGHVYRFRQGGPDLDDRKDVQFYQLCELAHTVLGEDKHGYYRVRCDRKTLKDLERYLDPALEQIT